MEIILEKNIIVEFGPSLSSLGIAFYHCNVWLFFKLIWTVFSLSLSNLKPNFGEKFLFLTFFRASVLKPWFSSLFFSFEEKTFLECSNWFVHVTFTTPFRSNCTWLVALWTFFFRNDHFFCWPTKSFVDKNRIPSEVSTELSLQIQNKNCGGIGENVIKSLISSKLGHNSSTKGISARQRYFYPRVESKAKICQFNLICKLNCCIELYVFLPITKKIHCQIVSQYWSNLLKFNGIGWNIKKKCWENQNEISTKQKEKKK